jgi:hypothetical protein
MQWNEEHKQDNFSANNYKQELNLIINATERMQQAHALICARRPLRTFPLVLYTNTLSTNRNGERNTEGQRLLKEGLPQGRR